MREQLTAQEQAHTNGMTARTGVSAADDRERR
jgi:hypothetical protein